MIDLQRADEGVYMCTASSKYGKASWSARLRLESLRTSEVAFLKSPNLAALPGPPSRPLVVSVQRSSLILAWTPHPQTGSSTLIGYQV